MDIVVDSAADTNGVNQAVDGNQDDPDATIEYDGNQEERRQQQQQPQRQQKRTRQPTPPPQEREDGDNEEIDLQALIQKAVNSAIGNAVADAMRPVLEELDVSRQRSQETEAENRALRSQLEHSKKTPGMDNNILVFYKN